MNQSQMNQNRQIHSSSLALELTVQDCFVEAIASSSALSPESGISGSPIAEPTWQHWFYTWLQQLNPTLSPNQSYEITLRLTDDTEIQALNAQYRHKDQPTDVLAFAALEIDYPTFEVPEDMPLYLGDIIISLETAQEQADEQRHPLHDELAWLATHGLLHLLGWDHPDEVQLQQMLEQQALLLQAIGLKINYFDAKN